jgi:hypothetical protein
MSRSLPGKTRTVYSTWHRSYTQNNQIFFKIAQIEINHSGKILKSETTTRNKLNCNLGDGKRAYSGWPNFEKVW